MDQKRPQEKLAFAYRKEARLSERTLKQAVSALFATRLAKKDARHDALADAEANERLIISEIARITPATKRATVHEVLNLMCLVRMVKGGHRRVPDLQELESKVKELKTRLGL